METLGPVIIWVGLALAALGASLWWWERRQAQGAQQHAFGRYEVLSTLAEGQIHTVYLARASSDGGVQRVYALEALRADIDWDESARETLLLEGHLAAAWNHPNLFGCVDIGRHAGQPFLVLDHVAGCTLSSLLAAPEAGASPSAIVSILLDVLAGLEALEEATRSDDASDLIQADVSPQTIWVGVDGVARVHAWGIGYLPPAAPQEPELADPAYAAPERVQGRPRDARSDVFSVGAVLWSALTKTPLFAAGDLEATLENVRSRPIPAPSQHGSSPPSLDPICLTALERSPVQRYQSAREMLVDLRKAAAAADVLGGASEVAAWVARASAVRPRPRAAQGAALSAG